MRAAALLCELAIANVITDAESPSFVEQRLRDSGRHVRFEVTAVHLRLVFHPPAREERRERELRKHDETRALAVCFAHQRDQALHYRFARIGALNRPELGGGDLEMSRHAYSLYVAAVAA